MQEVIDGPLFKSPETSREILAADMLRALASHVLRQEEIEDNPAYYMSSWVESADAKLGHSLAISVTPNANLGPYPEIAARFFTADRENHRVVESTEAIALINPGMLAMERVKSLAQRFERDELELISRMVGKSILLPRDPDSRVDRDIHLALAYENLDELAELFPNNTTSENTPTKQPNKHETPEFINAAQQLLAEVPAKDNRKEIAVKKSFGDTDYIVHLISHNGELFEVAILKHSNNAWFSESHMYPLDDDPEENDEGLEDTAPFSQMSLDKMVETLVRGKSLSLDTLKAYHRKADQYSRDVYETGESALVDSYLDGRHEHQ